MITTGKNKTVEHTWNNVEINLSDIEEKCKNHWKVEHIEEVKYYANWSKKRQEKRKRGNLCDVLYLRLKLLAIQQGTAYGLGQNPNKLEKKNKIKETMSEYLP